MTEGKGAYKFLWLTALILLQGGIFAQSNALIQFDCKIYPFIHPERNEIINARILDSFFNKLYLQKTAQNQRINILQIGDSHIQADFSSAMIRTDFQNDFGNAGRGIVVPLRVAGSNEPFNYKITSNVVCTSKRCVFVDNPLPIGIGGVTIKTTNDSTIFHIKTFDYPPLNYSFNKLTLFYLKTDSSYDFALEDTLGTHWGIINNHTASAYPNTAIVHLPIATNDILLKTTKVSDAQTEAMVFAINLESDNSGVIYHAIGVNGAEAYQYARAKYFTEQTAAVNPDVIIISLGTNEAQRIPIDKELVRSRIDSLCRQLKQANPGKPIILATPADSYYHKKYYNASVAAVHTIWVDYAKENGLAVWDLFSIAGGYKSCYQWKKYALMQRDGVHFTRKGYELQGNLLYQAITKAYNKYVSHRFQ